MCKKALAREKCVGRDVTRPAAEQMRTSVELNNAGKTLLRKPLGARLRMGKLQKEQTERETGEKKQKQKRNDGVAGGRRGV